MKQLKIYLLLILISLSLSCQKDLGNYDYKAIVDVQIEGVKKSYSVITGADTLRIDPQLIMANIDQQEGRFTYYWIVRAGTVSADTISATKSLNYPVALAPRAYTLHLHVRDTETGILWEHVADLTIGTRFSRGLMLIGDDEEGNTDVNMISMGADTTVIRDILKNSGLPPLRGPIAIQHTGGPLTQTAKLWLMTKSGSYFMDRQRFTSSTANVFSTQVYTSFPISPADMQPVVVAPQINNITGTMSEGLAGRVMLTKDGNLYGPNVADNSGDFYANPINRLANDLETLLPAAPFLMYPVKLTSSMVWYDTDNERFLRIPAFYSTYNSVTMSDAPDDLFSWNQAATGRTLLYAENSINNDGGAANGNSFAIMKDQQDNHFIYKFYVNGPLPQKNGYYPVKGIATNFGRATQYAFSSLRTLVFYIADGILYAYDYNPNNEKLYQLSVANGDEVTMIKFDTQIYPLVNSLYIATYNSTTKGSFQRFTLDQNPNTVNLQPIATEKWDNLIKVKNWSWRAVN